MEKTILLNNGVKMPRVGYGVFQVSPDECYAKVSDALSVGYRSIDTAQAYQNEEGVGRAWRESGIDRKDLFLTTKVWISNAGEEKAYASILRSLEKLQTEYIDLLLIHQPFGDYYGTYRAMERAYREGKVRAIGVSNFHYDRFVDLAENVEIKPAVNQIETHVFTQNNDMASLMAHFDTKMMAWGPLAEGQNNLFNHPVLTAIGEKYGKSAAQVALRYLLERDVIIIPKSSHKERMEQNISLFDFSLSTEDMAEIVKLDGGKGIIVDFTNTKGLAQLVEHLKMYKV